MSRNCTRTRKENSRKACATWMWGENLLTFRNQCVLLFLFEFCGEKTRQYETVTYLHFRFQEIWAGNRFSSRSRSPHGALKCSPMLCKLPRDTGWENMPYHTAHKLCSCSGIWPRTILRFFKLAKNEIHVFFWGFLSLQTKNKQTNKKMKFMFFEVF